MNGEAPVGRIGDWDPVDDDAAPWPRYERKAGPGVILMHEFPGITPEVLGLGDFLFESGFTVVIPHLFGVRGEKGNLVSNARTGAALCVSRRFQAWALGADRPIARQLRAFAAQLAERTGGQVGVIGMCFTGGFALAAAVDPRVAAPVVSQPSIPIALPGRRRSDTGVSEEELAEVHRRTSEEGLCVLGLRFSEDLISPGARFEALTKRLGTGFRVIELDSSRGNPDKFGRCAHSVLTAEVREKQRNAATTARDEVAAFLHERLDAGR